MPWEKGNNTFGFSTIKFIIYFFGSRFCLIGMGESPDPLELREGGIKVEGYGGYPRKHEVIFLECELLNFVSSP